MKSNYLLLLVLFSSCLEPIEPKKPKINSIVMPDVVGRLAEFKKNETKSIEKASPYDKLSSEEKYKYELYFVQEMTLVTRRLDPTDQEIHNWLNALLQGATREGVYRGLVSDQYYYRIENEPILSNRQSNDFTKDYMSKFLFQKFNEELLNDVNPYTLKRIVCEKTLDVIDALRANPDELYTWYAMFSAYLATGHSQIMNNQMRKNNSESVHYEWAKSMPEQHIKTEVLTKLHMVYNSLNQI